MDDLEVEDGLALRLFWSTPACISLHGEHRVEGGKAELGSELVEVAEVLQVVDLGQEDRLSAAVEARIAKRFEVVVREDVGWHQASRPHRVAARPAVVVKAADVGGHSGYHRRQLGLIKGRVERRSVRQSVAFDVELEQESSGWRGAVDHDQAGWRHPGRLQAGVVQRA